MTTDSLPPTLRARAESQDADLGTPSHPGRKIRLARERARLTLEELATLTKLARPTLDALERDDFETLHEPVYIRGYYRKCAKVLGLSESDLIAGYERLAAPKAPPVATRLIGSSQTMTSSLSSRRPASGAWLWALPLLLVVGAAAYFLIEDPAAVGLVSRSEPVIVAPPTSETALPMPVNAETIEDLAVQTPSENTPATEVTALAPDLAAPLLPPAQEGPLLLQFNSTSWVLIEDADGRVLMSGLRGAGASETLSGRPPYSLLIGYAPGVTVAYEGKPFDLGPYIKSSHTARVSVP